jgi:hypothetical protein
MTGAKIKSTDGTSVAKTVKHLLLDIELFWVECTDLLSAQRQREKWRDKPVKRNRERLLEADAHRFHGQIRGSTLILCRNPKSAYRQVSTC